MPVNPEETIKKPYDDVICGKTTVILLEFLRKIFLSVADYINRAGLISFDDGFVMNSLC